MIIKGIESNIKKGLIKVFEDKKTHRDKNIIIIVLEEPFMSKHRTRGKVRLAASTRHINGKRVTDLLLGKDAAEVLSATLEEILKS